MTSTAILSPHPDDAVLSLWHVLDGPGEVKVINLFAAPPNGSADVGEWDRRTDARDPASRAIERQEEDRKALGLAGREPDYLEFLDYQYRGGDPRPAQLAEAVSSALGGATRVLVPAALGDHHDHRLARAAGLALRSSGVEVTLYADLPHATSKGWPGWVTGSADGGADVVAAWEAAMEGTGISLSELNPVLRMLDPEQVGRKREAIGCYATQLGALREAFPMVDRPEILRHEVTWCLAG